MNKLVSKNPVQRFKQGKKIVKVQFGGGVRGNNIITPIKIGPLMSNNKWYDNYGTQITPEKIVPQKDGRIIAKINGQWYNQNGQLITNFISNNKSNARKPTTSKQPSTFMGVKAGNAGMFSLTDEQKSLLDQNGIKYGTALELQQGLNNYMSSNGINGSILEDNMWGDQSKKALDYVLNKVNQNGTRRFDNQAPGQIIQAVTPSAPELIKAPEISKVDIISKPLIQNVRNNSYNKADIRDLIRKAGLNAYGYTGDQRKALRRYLNGESDDTSLLAGTDLARFIIPYQKKGGLISKNPIKRFKEGSSFGKAFRQARNSGLKEFTWNGKRYTTELKEEKEAREKKQSPKINNNDHSPLDMKKKSIKKDGKEYAYTKNGNLREIKNIYF